LCWCFECINPTYINNIYPIKSYFHGEREGEGGRGREREREEGNTVVLGMVHWFLVCAAVEHMWERGRERGERVWFV
jgi:hypothetical protein